MIKNKIIIACLLLCIILNFLLVACSSESTNEIKHNATLYTSDFVMKDNFKKENATKSTNLDDYQVAGESLPKERIIIIKNNEEKHKAFESVNISVDFNKEMLVICTFTAYYSSKMWKLNEVKNDKERLVVKFIAELKKGYDSATPPTQLWYVIKMDKMEVSDTLLLHIVREK